MVLMLLKELKLKNIRSYVDETLSFPQGSVLLAGDIGAGKSTVLLAIEFALFGLVRGEITGSSLLRHGAREGSVELTFALKNKPVTIKRVLKRTKNSVEQSAGWIILDGKKQDATATELKSTVLDLLGYPKDLLTKNKSLIFRYTVYTPQEDMKRILLEDSETRLNILRKVFNIDKYKRIKENAAVYARTLRERKRALETTLTDEQQKREEREKLKREREKTRAELEALAPMLDKHKKNVAEQKKLVEELEQKRQAFNQKQQELASCKAELQAVISQQKNVQEQHEKHKEKIRQLQEQARTTLDSPEGIAKAIARQTEQLQVLEQKTREKNSAVGELIAQQRVSQTLVDKINSLQKCPVCLQNVTEKHKHDIKTTETQKAQEYAQQIQKLQEELGQLEKQKKQVSTGLEMLRQKQAQAMQAKMQQQQLTEAQQQLAILEQQQKQLVERSGKLEQQQKKLENALQGLPALEEELTTTKKTLEHARQEEQKAMLEHARLAEHEKYATQLIERLTQELKQKEQARQQLSKLNTHHAWLTEHFVPLMDTIEKHVMAQVYHEFNDLFQRWLSLLIEGEMLTARLDDTFTPVTQQNGYDVDYSSLSGGEKTACALAYRLALNKVINDLIETIHTKNLLILDEPTDGFSNDQLDKMRDVLEQLNNNQTILVSHEAKIESLVDHVVRVSKDAHASKITA